MSCNKKNTKFLTSLKSVWLINSWLDIKDKLDILSQKKSLLCERGLFNKNWQLQLKVSFIHLKFSNPLKNI